MNLVNIEKILGYEFADSQILIKALTHPSMHRKSKKIHMTFEKLEFLGDRVLGLCLSTILYKKYTNEDEAIFAIRLAHLASTSSLVDVAKSSKLINEFYLPHDEIEHGASSVADMVEATLAAVFLDGGLDAAINVVNKLFGKKLSQDINREKDAKSKLQEYSQGINVGLPIYSVQNINGPQHDITFTIKVEVGKLSAVGIGKNKKMAEQDAAKNLLLEIDKCKKNVT